MPFARPTLSELVTRTKADLRGRLDILGPLLRRVTVDILATVWAGLVHMVHGHLAWLARQLFPDTSDEEMLLRQAAVYSITPTPAQLATGIANVAGIDGNVIPDGAVLVNSDGSLYDVTDGPQTITGGVAVVTLQAQLAGSAGNMDFGESLDFESPIPGVEATVTVGLGGLSGGVEQGSVESTRSRLIDRLREPPAGGREADYKAWAKAVSGVTRVWVFPNENGLGTVVVRFVLDEEDPIFPDGAKVAEVQAALEEQRPVTAEVTAVAPTPLEVDFTLSVTPDTPGTRIAVEAELTDLFFRDAEPGDGAGSGTVLLSRILMAIGFSGVDDFTLTTPNADVVPALGELVVMGTITWV